MKKPKALCAAFVLVALGAALLLVACGAVHAGAQQYEPLAENVRSAMSAAISDRSAPYLSFKDPEAARLWLNEMSSRLSRRIPDRKTRTELLKTVHHESMRAGLDPQLVLGLMEVESGFRKYAISSAGAQGYMQVMPFWINLIGGLLCCGWAAARGKFTEISGKTLRFLAAWAVVNAASSIAFTWRTRLLLVSCGSVPGQITGQNHSKNRNYATAGLAVLAF